MYLLESVMTLYTDYLEETTHLIEKYRPGDGLFGMTAGPKSDACHERFITALEQLLSPCDLVPSQEASDVLQFIYSIPTKHRNPNYVYWTLMAVHALTLPVIEQLSPEDAEAVQQKFETLIPKNERLPAQKKVVSALKRRHHK